MMWLKEDALYSSNLSNPLQRNASRLVSEIAEALSSFFCTPASTASKIRNWIVKFSDISSTKDSTDRVEE